MKLRARTQRSHNSSWWRYAQVQHLPPLSIDVIFAAVERQERPTATICLSDNAPPAYFGQRRKRSGRSKSCLFRL